MGCEGDRVRGLWFEGLGRPVEVEWRLPRGEACRGGPLAELYAGGRGVWYSGRGASLVPLRLAGSERGFHLLYAALETGGSLLDLGLYRVHPSAPGHAECLLHWGELGVWERRLALSALPRGLAGRLWDAFLEAASVADPLALEGQLHPLQAGALAGRLGPLAGRLSQKGYLKTGMSLHQRPGPPSSLQNPRLKERSLTSPSK